MRVQVGWGERCPPFPPRVWGEGGGGQAKARMRPALTWSTYSIATILFLLPHPWAALCDLAKCLLSSRD